jgi:hypothetical protein
MPRDAVDSVDVRAQLDIGPGARADSGRFRHT